MTALRLIRVLDVTARGTTVPPVVLGTDRARRLLAPVLWDNSRRKERHHRAQHPRPFAEVSQHLDTNAGVLTIVHTWPLARAPTVYLQGHADVTAGMWALTELARQILRDPLHLMNGNIFYPYPNTLAVLDHQLANALLAVPLVVAGAGSVFIYNAVVLASFFLSGLFTYLLVRRWCAD